MLRGRTISLPTRIAAIRAEPERARRRALLASLAEDSRRDQEPFATFVRDQLGARVLAQHWVLNACTIEIPRARLADASRHTSVVRLWPNEERSPSSFAGRDLNAAALPIGTSGSADNHNITEAHNLLPHRGAGAIFALFDTGVDLDQTSPHIPSIQGRACPRGELGVAVDLRSKSPGAGIRMADDRQLRGVGRAAPAGLDAGDECRR